MNVQTGPFFVRFTDWRDCFEEFAQERTVRLYLPYTVLLFIQRGGVQFKQGGQFYSFKENSYCLIRKHTPLTYYLPTPIERGETKLSFVSLTNDFLRKVATAYPFPKHLTPIPNRIIDLLPTTRLASLFQQIQAQHKRSFPIRECIAREAFEAILAANEKLAVIFKPFTLAARTDLEDFIQQNYLRNLPIAALAKEAGRSLSTFNREFKLIFGEPPHRWILKRRLQDAREILLTTEKPVNEICIAAGFQDLSHFGKAFRKMYGVTPSEMRKATAKNQTPQRKPCLRHFDLFELTGAAKD